jgi:hypothetical protein
MALFTDGPINGTQDLALYDSSLLETATAEGIDVDAKIANAQDTIQTEIVTFLLDNRSIDPVFGDVVSYRRRTLGVSDVVVTAELKRWHAFQALRDVYQDANGHQSNDRYQWKWQEYGTATRTARARCLDIGIGLTGDPIPRAQAPLVTTVVGAGAPVTFYFAVALINAEGQEGLASELVTVNVAAAMQAQVSLSNPPSNAQSWNVYAGNGPEALMRQNSEAIAVSASWTQPDVLSAGSAPGNGQAPSFYAVQNRVIRRG